MGHEDRALAVVTRADGSVVVGGVEGSLTFETSGETRAFVAQVGADGSVGEVSYLDHAGLDAIEALRVGPDGRVLFAARSVGSEMSARRDERSDIIVGVLEADGTLSRLAQMGDERPQHPRGLDVAADGSLLISGYDEAWVPGNYVADWENPFVYRVAPGDDGAMKATTVRAERTPAPDFQSAVLADPGGDLFVAGLRTSKASRGAFVSRLGVDGSERWTTRLTRIALDGAEALGRGRDGSVLVGGSTLGLLGPVSAGGEDAFVASLDPDSGEVRWVWQGGTEGPDYLTGMAVDADGSIVVAGETIVEHPTPATGPYEAFVWRLSPTGAPLASWRGGTIGDDAVAGVALGACGRIHVVGSSDGIMPGERRGHHDAFLLTLTPDDLTPAP